MGWSHGVHRLLHPGLLIRLGLAVAVVVFLLPPLADRVVAAAAQLETIDSRLAATGFLLQVVSLLAYSAMTQVALGDERHIVSLGRLFRIQLVSRVVTSTVPGGVAAGPAAGYHLFTAAGVSGRTSSAALASSAVTSSVVLNLLLWAALVISIPLYGFNAIYAAAALLGVVLMLAVAGAFVAIVDGSPLLERPVRAAATRLGRDADAAMQSIRAFGSQIEDLLQNRAVVTRLAGWAAANWLLDAASLWVFLRAFGVTMGPVGLIVAFGVANVLAAIPLSPGGVGIVEWAYIPILFTFGASLEQATIAVVSYRIAQFLFPIALGGISYVSLVVQDRLAGRRSCFKATGTN